MPNAVFEHGPSNRKLVQYFLWLELSDLALVFGLIALKIEGLAVGLFLLTLLIFMALLTSASGYWF